MIDVVIDVSHYDDTPDWTQVQAAGILALIHKATQGTTYVDPTFAAAKAAVPALGLLWGAYHFGTGDAEGSDQAKFFLDTVQPDAHTLCAIDFEVNSTPGETTMSLDHLFGWIETVQSETGRAPVVYGGNGLLFPQIGSATHPTLAACPLWLSDYTSAAQPAVTIPSQIWTTWTFWQYTQSGSVPGISVPVDREQYNGTAEDLKAKWPF